MLKISIFLLFVFVFSFVSAFDEENCGLANPVSRVFDGEKVKHRKYPWLAHLSITKEDGESMCGGVLISHKLVLTAAHCVHNMKGKEKEITLKNGNKRKITIPVHSPVKPEAVKVYLDLVSTDDESSNSVAHSVEKIMSGIFYADNILGYDTALLVLKNPVEFSKKTAPICLPTFDGEPYEGQKFTVTGWGEASTRFWFGKLTKSFFLPSHAREAEVDHIPGKKCIDIYAKIVGEKWASSEYNEDREVCAIGFNSMADACGGDSGGPLMWKNPENGRYYLVGTVARGPECPNKEKRPGVYTKIQPYMDFIKKVENGEKLEYEMIGTSRDVAQKKLEELVAKMASEKSIPE